MRCAACGRQCRKVTVDFGIGAYEYWGAPGVDIQLADVSDCCEADFMDEDDHLDDRPSCMMPDCDRVVEHPEYTDLCTEHQDGNLEYGNKEED
jgi:hypothetical protein